MLEGLQHFFDFLFFIFVVILGGGGTLFVGLGGKTLSGTLKESLASLEDILESMNRPPEPDENPEISRSFLQTVAARRFEDTFDLSVKKMRRELRGDEMPCGELISRAVEYGILNAPAEKWLEYGRLRGLISHSGGGAAAAQIGKIIPEFCTDVRKLIDGLNAKKLHPKN